MAEIKQQQLFDLQLLPKNYLNGSVPRNHRQGPVGIGNKFFLRFFVTYRINEPVIYETDMASGGFARPNRMTWKVKARNYYKKGDAILYGEMSQKSMQYAFPTLAPQNNSKSLLQNLIDSEILGPSPMGKYAFIIWDIRPSLRNPGYGEIHLKPILFFGTTAVLLFDERCKIYSTKQFSDNLAFHKAAQNMQGILPFLYATMEIVQLVLTGAAKSALSKSASVFITRKAAIHAVTNIAQRQAKKAILLKIGKVAVKASIIATYAFVVELLKKMTVQQEESLRKMADKSKSVDYFVFDSALKYATQAFIMTFISECLGYSVSKMAEQLGVTSSLKLYIAQKFASTPKEIVNALVTAYRNADEDRKRKKLGNKPQKAELEKYTLKECTGLFQNLLKDITKQLTLKF